MRILAAFCSVFILCFTLLPARAQNSRHRFLHYQCQELHKQVAISEKETDFFGDHEHFSFARLISFDFRKQSVVVSEQKINPALISAPASRLHLRLKVLRI
jgi:hypothetical protein